MSGGPGPRGVLGMTRRVEALGAFGLIGAVVDRLNPDNRTAEQWVRQELDKDVYGGGASLLERLWLSLLDWFSGLFRGGGQAQDPSGLVNVVVAIVVTLALGGLIYLLITRVRRSASIQEATDRTVLGGTSGTAAGHRSAAAAAFARADWDTAVLEWTRAIAREGDERTLLGAAESLTAQEVGDRLAPYFPDQASELARAMVAFDSVAYGGRPANAVIAGQVRDTDRAVHRSRPARQEPDLVPAADSGWTMHP